MERESKVFSVYRVTDPTGMQYVGYTSMPVKERWRCHCVKAALDDAVGHPLYDAIRKYGKEQFTVQTVAWSNERLEALMLEEELIAAIPEGKAFNLSSGGVNDASEGGRLFWERLNADPEKKSLFLKKLSETKLADDWTDYADLAQRALNWRKEHPREAYKISYRAIRIANRMRGVAPPSYCPTDERPLKERLMHKYKLNEIKRQNSIKSWQGYSPEKRAEIGRKISEAQLRRYADRPQDDTDRSCAHAREHIDREKQGKAASNGLKKWWRDLKNDPDRYKAYMETRTASLKRGKECVG